MSDDRLDSKLRQVFKERCLALETDNKALRDALQKAQQEGHAALQRNEVLRENMQTLNDDWASRYSKEREACQFHQRRYNDLEREFSEAIDINTQLTDALAEFKETVQREVSLREVLERENARAVASLSDARAALHLLEEQCRGFSANLSTKESSIAHLEKALQDAVASDAASRVRLQRAEEELQKNIADLQMANAGMVDRDKSIAANTSSLQAAEDYLQEANLKCSSAIAECDALKSELSGLREQCVKMEVSMRSGRDNEAALNAKCLSLEETLVSSQTKLQEITDKSALSEEAVVQLTRQLESMEGCSEHMVASRIEMEHENSRLQSQVGSLQTALDEMRAALHLRDEEFSVSEAKIAELTDSLEAASNALSEERERLDDLTGRNASLSLELARFADDIRYSTSKIFQLEAALADAKGKCDALEDQASLHLASRRDAEEQIVTLKHDNSSLLEMNQKLTVAATECQDLLSASKAEFSKQLGAKSDECSVLSEKLSGYEREFGLAIQEIQTAQAMIESQKGEAARLMRSDDASALKIQAQEVTIAGLRRELEAARRNLDGVVSHIAELETASRRREEERRVMQIELLQLRGQLKKEQEEMSSISAAHQSMRDAFEQRAKQNQDVVNAADARASSLETELSEVISKYNSLAQTHKEVRLKCQQLVSQLADAQQTNSSTQSESDTLARQRRLMYELNLRLAEQETVVRDLTTANRALHCLIASNAGRHHEAGRSVFSVQPLNTLEGPIRHPKKLRAEVSAHTTKDTVPPSSEKGIPMHR